MWCSKLSQVPEFLQHLFIYHVLCKIILSHALLSIPHQSL